MESWFVFVGDQCRVWFLNHILFTGYETVLGLHHWANSLVQSLPPDFVCFEANRRTPRRPLCTPSPLLHRDKMAFSTDDVDEIMSALLEAMQTVDEVSFHLNSRVLRYRGGPRTASHPVHEMCTAMRRFSIQHGVNSAYCILMHTGDRVGPAHFFQRGLAHLLPGRSLDLVGGSPIYTVCFAGYVEFALLDEAGVVVRTQQLAPGEVMQISADENRSLKHQIDISDSAGVCFLVTFGLNQLAGAQPGEWTTPARRLAPRCLY